MLNTKKLLYILPDVAYVAELLPGKKEHSFSIQAFRQINGEFIDDNEFIADHAMKLVGKLDKDEYTLVLPDFLFTNTIVEVEETNESKVKDYIKEKLLPSLGLNRESHDIKSFVLTQHGGKSKIQLSALEKSLLNPISAACKEKDIKISHIVALSWTLKSVISLEPSVSIVQMGSRIYLAEHYIGVDQANSAAIDEVETLAETIKTLKGVESSLQTVYLLTNSLIEKNLKDLLSGTLPLQQLTSSADEASEIPPYVKDCIEAGMKTLSIPDFAVPSFPLNKPTEPVAVPPAEAESKPESESAEPDKEEETEPSTQTEEATEIKPADETDAETADLPKPSQPPTVDDGDKSPAASETPSLPEKPELPSAVSAATPIASTSAATPILLDEPEDTTKSETTTSETKPADANVTPVAASSDDKVESAAETAKLEWHIPSPHVTVPKPNAGMQSFLKMAFIALAVFFATVGVGVGLGLGFISLNKQKQPATPVVLPSPSPTSEPSPSPSPSPDVDSVKKEDLSILVVNATTKAGYAGKTKSALEKVGFGTVKASNAKGDYQEDTYVLMKEKDEALISVLEKTLDQTLSFSSDIAVEDPKGEFDAVIVLAQ